MDNSCKDAAGTSRARERTTCFPPQNRCLGFRVGTFDGKQAFFIDRFRSLVSDHRISVARTAVRDIVYDPTRMNSTDYLPKLLHSRKLTWKPKKGTVLVKGYYMGFHVSLGECIPFRYVTEDTFLTADHIRK